ncbi:MAG: divergent polysaccharide deacetylase family protein, partial [Firmicutes bacterium]|nr:divergent polysaccharide deacetylase family protein [Bacillota bacterium]
MKKAFYLVLTIMLVLITAQSKLYIGNMDVAVFNRDEGGYLAIIIDDFGYGGEGTESMLELDIPFTAAVMPFSTRSKEDLELIKNAGKEYIVHLPMESLTGKREWVGDKGVFTDMTEEEIREVTEEAI